jgi:hypothetical protein
VIDRRTALKALASAVLLHPVAEARADPPAPKFTISTRRKDDSVEVQQDKDRAVFDVKSPFGISRAVIERQEGDWPRAVVLRLHLKGLENFRASNGKVGLQAAAGIRDGKPEVRVWKDGQENVPLDEGSPLWVSVRIIAGDGKPAKELPLKDGYFELVLPRSLFEGSPKSITVQWIDFYR